MKGCSPYNRHVLSKNLMVIMFLAFCVQAANVISIVGQPNLQLLDFYILNGVGDIMIETVVGWSIPLLVGWMMREQFLFYRSRENIFLRTKQLPFVLKCSLKSFLFSTMWVFLFYSFCYIFLILIGFFMGVDILSGVSLTLSMSYASSALYFSYPLFYLLIYVIVISLFGGVFGLIGFYCSLYIENKIIVTLSPFVLMMPMIFLIEPIPYSSLFNYNNIMMLSGMRYTHLPFSVHLICMFGSIVALFTILEFLIWIKSRGNLC